MVDAMLASAGLSAYATVFDDEGYDDLDYLREIARRTRCRIFTTPSGLSSPAEQQALRAALLAGDAGAGPSAPVEVDAEDVTVDEETYVRNARGVVVEVDGLRLHLSETSSTGYRGVKFESSNFTADFKVEACALRQREDRLFETAVEAAVAYARRFAQHEAKLASEAAAAAVARIATEAEGLRLHLSSKTSTGYLGVKPGQEWQVPSDWDQKLRFSVSTARRSRPPSPTRATWASPACSAPRKMTTQRMTKTTTTTRGKTRRRPATRGWACARASSAARTARRRSMYDEPVDGTIIKWLPADGDDEALWRMRDDDGDYQDFDEEEAEAALRAFDEQQLRAPPRRGRRRRWR